MNIQDALLTPSKYTRPRSPMKEVKAIVVHYTANPGTSAKANRNYFESLGATGAEYASAHYIIGIAGEILRMIPENEEAYHCGGMHYTDLARELFTQNGNVYPHNLAIGIEVCIPDQSGKFNDASMASLKMLVWDIAKRYNIPKDKIIRHYDVTGKLCPVYYVEHPDEWDSFKNGLGI